MDTSNNKTYNLYTVKNFDLYEEVYSEEDLARFKQVADQWRIIDYRSFSEQSTLKYKDLLKSIYAKRRYDVRKTDYSSYAICDGQLCGFVKELGNCDINGGMGGWSGIRKSVIRFSDAEKTLRDYNSYSYTYSTRNSYEAHTYALVKVEALKEILPEEDWN